MRVSVRDIIRHLEGIAPPALAEGWDNVGLLVGDGYTAVSSVLVALDASADVLDQAEACHAELLVVHHPLIFSGLQRLVEDDGVGTLVRRLVLAGRSLIAAHTNLDAAPQGLNHYVAARLGLQEIRPLIPAEARPLMKLVVYVPEGHVDAVREAICDAGAGQIGQYRDCTFGVTGTGTFRPEEGASPYIGSAGILERVAEVRLETVLPRAALGPVLAAMLAAHPYEEVAYDLFPLEQRWPGAGLGRIGTLAQPEPVGAFLQRVREVLGTSRLAVIGECARDVRTIALCTGAGGDFLEAAHRAGADLYLTGEVKHHQALLARQQGMVVIDAGHFATERPVVPLLSAALAQQFPELTVVPARETDPFTAA
jgi:dinuclear metal center YbgI/SA1388 family protein